MREWYHFHACVFSRSKNHSAVAAAAYRSGSKLYSREDGLTKDYSDRADRDEIAHSEILAPDGAPEWVHDREELWNRVEAAETRSDSQLAREVRFALARELSAEERIEVTRDFVREHFTSQGMIADLNIHQDPKNHNPHAHILLTTRRLDGDEFGPKAREWNNKARLKAWREGCARSQNRVLERRAVTTRADHRSYKERGIDLEPGFHVGPKGWAVGSRLHKESRYGRARSLVRPHRGDYERSSSKPRHSTRQQPPLPFKPKKPRKDRRGIARGQTIVSGIMWGGKGARTGISRHYDPREGLRYAAQRQRRAVRIKQARKVTQERDNRDRFDRMYKNPREARHRFTRYAAEKGMRAAFVRLNREPERYGSLTRPRTHVFGAPTNRFGLSPSVGQSKPQGSFKRPGGRERDRDRNRGRER